LPEGIVIMSRIVVTIDWADDPGNPTRIEARRVLGVGEDARNLVIESETGAEHVVPLSKAVRSVTLVRHETGVR
jgi:hypothetical protein